MTVARQSSSESSTHPCLRDVEISNSQLKLLNLYNTHSVPGDPGLTPALWVLETKSTVYSSDSLQKFTDLVRESRLRPIQIVEGMLQSDGIDLKYYGIDPRIVKAICQAIEDHIAIEIINLEDNWLSNDACYHLSELLLNNNVIKFLRLSNCRIGPNGAKELRNGLSQTVTLTNLDLNGCNINDEGLKYISEAISENESVEYLDLSKNCLTEECADNLHELIVSKTLKSLNLSWNFLYSAKCWEILGTSLLNSETIQILNLSWNALGRECVPFLGQLLSVSMTLKHLNLSNNIFDQQDAKFIGTALSNNKTLEELYIGNNPLKAEGVKILITSIFLDELSAPSLCVLDLENIWANKDILPEISKIRETRLWLTINLQGILSNYTLKGPDVRKIFLQRAYYEAMKPKKKKLRKNFTDFINTLENQPISITHFKELIRKWKLKLSESLINGICKAFANSDDFIDQKALKAYYFKTIPRKLFFLNK